MATSKCFTVFTMCGLVSTKLGQQSQVLFRVQRELLLGDLFIHNHLHLSRLSILRCIHGTCMPINSYSYSCRCQPGFSGVLCDEEDQDAANPCSLSRCKHGKCRVSGLGKAYCECYSGYTGEACDRGKKNGSVSLCGTYYLCHCKQTSHFFLKKSSSKAVRALDSVASLSRPSKLLLCCLLTTCVFLTVFLCVCINTSNVLPFQLSIS